MLCFSGVSVDYGTGADAVHAVADTSLCVERGTVLALIGASGCGKSTLLRVGAGLLRPTAGTVTSEGAFIDPRTLRIGFLPQNYGLLAWKTVRENILLGVQIKGEWNAQQMNTFDEIVLDLGLSELLTRYPRELSGGQQQRVGLARVFLLAPDLLLMDEPFSALDAITRESMQEVFLSLWKKHAVATLHTAPRRSSSRWGRNCAQRSREEACDGKDFAANVCMRYFLVSCILVDCCAAPSDACDPFA